MCPLRSTSLKYCCWMWTTFLEHLISLVLATVLRFESIKRKRKTTQRSSMLWFPLPLVDLIRILAQATPHFDAIWILMLILWCRLFRYPQDIENVKKKIKNCDIFHDTTMKEMPKRKDEEGHYVEWPYSGISSDNNRDCWCLLGELFGYCFHSFDGTRFWWTMFPELLL